MSRPRVYKSNAERQKAYRARLEATKTAGPPINLDSSPRRRRQSRPTRLATLHSEAVRLHHEYQTWLDSIPDTLLDGPQATRLSETIEALESVVDQLSQIDPPRGFGRD